MRLPLSAAYSELTRAQKPVKGISLYSRYINRPLGRVFAAIGAAVGLTPNQMTMVSAAATAGAVATIAIAEPSWISGLAITGLIVLGFALDAADGQLARLTRTGSLAGEWFDHLVDAGKAVCLHGAVLIAAFRFFHPDLLWLLVPLGYQLVSVLIQAGGTLRELIGRLTISGPKAAGVGRRWSAVGLLVADSGVFGLAFLTWPWPRLFMIVYSALFLANAVIGALLLVKWMRELTALSE